MSDIDKHSGAKLPSLRVWRLTVQCHAKDDLVTTNEHILESTGQPDPRTMNQFLNFHGNGKVVSYNSNNVHNWTLEEITEKPKQEGAEDV